MKILVVEDDDIIREMIVQSIEDFGYKVLVAGDLDHALSYTDPDIVITDLSIPKTSGRMADVSNGVEVVKHFKALKVPVIIASYSEEREFIASIHHATLAEDKTPGSILKCLSMVLE